MRLPISWEPTGDYYARPANPMTVVPPRQVYGLIPPAYQYGQHVQAPRIVAPVVPQRYPAQTIVRGRPFPAGLKYGQRLRAPAARTAAGKC